MDENLKDYLGGLKIKYKIHEHKPVFTVEQSKKIKQKIPGLSTKCLFLKDENKQFYLICLSSDKRLNTKIIKSYFNIKELQFASPDELKNELNVTPGSVSIFSMIYAKNIILIVDKEIWQADIVSFHPNINIATLEINHEDLEKFYNSLKTEKYIIEL